MGLSVKILELKGIVIHPTVEEIGEYTGLASKSTLSNKDIKKEEEQIFDSFYQKVNSCTDKC